MASAMSGRPCGLGEPSLFSPAPWPREVLIVRSDEALMSNLRGREDGAGCGAISQRGASSHAGFITQL